MIEFNDSSLMIKGLQYYNACQYETIQQNVRHSVKQKFPQHKIKYCWLANQLYFILLFFFNNIVSVVYFIRFKESFVIRI